MVKRYFTSILVAAAMIGAVIVSPSTAQASDEGKIIGGIVGGLILGEVLRKHDKKRNRHVHRSNRQHSHFPRPKHCHYRVTGYDRYGHERVRKFCHRHR